MSGCIKGWLLRKMVSCEKGGGDALARANAYRQVLRDGISDDGLVALRGYIRQERALGSARSRP
jgi:hypothetical protein